MTQEAKDAIEKEKRFSIEGDDNTQSISAVSEFHTLEEVLKYAEVDLDIWEVERHIINKWSVGSKLGHKGAETIRVTPLWQVKIWLRRRVQKDVQDAVELLMKRMDKHSPRYANLPKIKPVSDPHLLEISIFDIHLGKLAWGEETGTDYDLKIAERIFHDAVIDLARKSKGFPIEKILFPIGQDFLHVDNAKFTTVNDTPQDADGRYSKIYETAVMACVRAIDYVVGIAPVEVLWVPGNHDRTTSYHLVHELKSWYRLVPRVSVDCSPELRKYYAYGKNLLGFAHGDDEKQETLPALMASDRPQEYCNAVTKEWHIGHRHKKNLVEYEVNGTNIGVRTLPSISGTDSWHNRKGYKNQSRAATAFLYSKTRGFSAQLFSLVGETK